jgi:hypothetical protein
MDTMTLSQAAEAFLSNIDAPEVNASATKGRFSLWCYWPSGDVLRDKACHGFGATFDEAQAQMMAEIKKAKLAKKTLKTAAECKEAVLNLIREHDAAPASFRDAVDELRVS